MRYLLQKGSQVPEFLARVCRFLASLTSTWSAPLLQLFLSLFVAQSPRSRSCRAGSGGTNLRPTMTSPLYAIGSSKGSVWKISSLQYAICTSHIRECYTYTNKLTLSCRGYHCGRGSSKILFSSGIRTSPRKSLRPNMSECQTVSQSVRDSRLLRLVWNYWRNIEVIRRKRRIVEDIMKNNYLECFIKNRIEGVFLNLRLSFSTFRFVG